MDALKPPTLRTDRLLMRRWLARDHLPLAGITSDPEVMRHRLAPLSQQETDRFIDEIEACFDEHGFGLWALERAEDGRLIGYAGLARSEFDAPFCPAVDVGWTLEVDAWGHGFATEAAIAALDFAFDRLRLDEVVAHTTELNRRSRAVMQRLGMTHDAADDFDGPWYPADDPKRRFVLYRTTAEEWRRRRGTRYRDRG